MSKSTTIDRPVKGKRVINAQLPHEFIARDYQRPLLHSLQTDGFKRACVVWHRRAGKDKTFLNHLIPAMWKRKGYYVYFFPTSAMGRRILWDGMDRDGFRFMDHFPDKLAANRNNQEMKITLKNGSLFQILGTDRIEQIGINPVGCVFSEYSRQSPKAWDLVRPILAENGGWAIFNFTPRGRNHAWDLLKMAKNNPDWYCEVLTRDDTDAISLKAIDDERKAGMSEDMIQQEFYCSFTLGAEGSYYGKHMDRALREGRIASVNHDSGLGVYTFWDLGIGDDMSIWFVQFAGREIHLIDFYTNTGYGFPHYISILDEKSKPVAQGGLGYHYTQHYAPHDIKERELSTGLTRLQRAEQLGISFIKVAELGVDEGIDLVRNLLDGNRCWFDEVKCEYGIRCLENYRKEYSDKAQVYAKKPKHDWASHAADAFRYMAVAYHEQIAGSSSAMTAERSQQLYEQYARPV